MSRLLASTIRRARYTYVVVRSERATRARARAGDNSRDVYRPARFAVAHAGHPISIMTDHYVDIVGFSWAYIRNRARTNTTTTVFWEVMKSRNDEMRAIDATRSRETIFINRARFLTGGDKFSTCFESYTNDSNRRFSGSSLKHCG